MSEQPACLFCGGDASAPDHFAHCDGQQGRAEALYGRMGDVPFEVGSDTSAAAAASLDTDDLSRLEAYVFGILKSGAQTCDAIEARTGLSHQTTSARIRGLVLRGLVIDSGARAQTRSGRRAALWSVKAETK